MSSIAPAAATAPPLLHFLQERQALRTYTAIRACDELASQMLNVAVGWYVYTATRDPMSLAYVGLAQFAPNMAVALIAGHTADRFDRRKILAVSFLAQALCLAAFGLWLWTRAPAAAPVYLLLLGVGAARAFAAPAMSAILPRLVAGEEFPRAVAFTTSVFQICGIVGPAIGGLIYAVSGRMVFAIVAGLYIVAMAEAWRLKGEHRATVAGKSDAADESVLAGIRYIRSNRLLLALISLDLFAVLLGGVSALLPIYARDILEVGPFGLGCLRCAPGLGAALLGLVLAHRTIRHGSGQLMLVCVGGFGVATVVFALSTNFWLSLVALAAAGGFDMVSMVIRQTLIQMSTPDSLRGRVSAVNWLFIGASSELGEFESGVTAALFGTVAAALLGGLGTLAVVLLWSRLFPELRRTDEKSIIGA